MVPRFLTAGSPIMPARRASAGIAFLTSADSATSICRVMAPMTSALPSRLMPFNSAMPPRSIRSLGLARRCFKVGSSVMPPASSLASSPLPACAAASATLFALWYAKLYIASALRHGFGAGFDRLDDVVIAGAAAEIALEPFADFRLGRLLVVLHQIERAHHHAGGAEAALQSVMLAEGRLHRMQLVALSDALDGDDVGAVALHGEDGAALDAVAIDRDDAAAALAGVAADMRAGEGEIFPQELDEQGARLDVAGRLLAVHRHGDAGHLDPPSRAAPIGGFFWSKSPAPRGPGQPQRVKK